MTAPRFFIADGIAPGQAGGAIALPESVAHHATRVLRLSVENALTLFDGRGGEYSATLSRVDKRGAIARLDAFDPVERESPLDVTLVQSVLATDAMDYAVRKAVELGVTRIVPVIAERSQRSLAGEKGEKRLMHWRSIAIAACEQCGRNRVPEVEAPLSFEAWLHGVAVRGTVAMAGPGARESLASLAAREVPHQLLIGPEGGFSDAEMAAGIARGAVAVHLGPRVLRAETAAVAALAMLAAGAGDAR